MFHALQEDSVLNHIAAKIIETLTTTKGPHAEVGISCLTVYLYVSPFFFFLFFPSLFSSSFFKPKIVHACNMS